MRAMALAGALAACGAPDAPSDVATGAANESDELSWTASAHGAELTLRGADGATVLALSCADGKMHAAAPGFTEIASEERFSLGADDQVFILVAQLGQDEGVRAEGAPADYFLDRLPHAASVHANYGAQNSGPHDPPAPDQARAFAAACRA